MARILSLIAAGALVLMVGCGRAVKRERAQAAALIDSVAALPNVERYGAAQVEQARRSIARGDSLRDAGNDERARAGYAEAVVYARLAVFMAESGSEPASVAKDSL